ncbi:Rieske [2Fe-2S] iron-sulfur domain-containing protein [Chytriomyces sp. MP71]|nr:Rieske [2Fe-2S] iron-sulfur domain-containing protein [Chytriomyces sp. MP71]
MCGTHGCAIAPQHRASVSSLQAKAEPPTPPSGYFFAGPKARFDSEITPIDTPLNKRFAIVHRRGTLSAVVNICPHQGAPLHKGAVTDIEDMGIVWGSAIVCRVHGWNFDVETGACGSTRFVIDTFDVKVEGGNVFVSLQPKNASTQGPRRDFGGKESEM